MLQLVAGLFVFFSQVEDQQLLDLQLLTGLADLRGGCGGLPRHGLPDPGGIFYLFLDVVDHTFQLCQIELHFLDFCLNLLLLALVVGSLVLDAGSAVDDDGGVLFDFLLPRLLLPHLGGDNRKLLSYFFDDHLGLLDDLQLLPPDHLLLLVLPLHLLDLFSSVVDSLCLRFNVLCQLFNSFFLVHDVDLELAAVGLLAVDHIPDGLDSSPYFLCALEGLLLLRAQLLDLLLLLLHLLLKSDADLLLTLYLLLQVLELGLHADDLDVQILRALRVVIRRIFYLQPHLLQLLLLLGQLPVLLFNRLYLLHVFLEDPLEVFNGVTSLFVHGLVLLDVQIVLLQTGLDLLLRHPEIVPHLLVHIRHLLVQLVSLKQQVLIRRLLRFVGHLRSLERAG